ncbi:alanine--tRNA ligase [Helicobacter sp. MIT 14-3879]|uniref:alanine--tRNA ligase n=1 Tax=Helicobacter sp. MIT 14-3879 TaxID=2040649 RepID=UPI000E1E7729|nr:alanine--tRNA ligase [Helicobacter sp. MIT 14-3879]RDU65070.1 alanine--tRNA ligase [Helicobacter sp. MIT 14-3879]
MIDIRDKFLKYFQNNEHYIYDSMPLVPDDPTLLFTNAGMVQFKDIFTGKIPPPTNTKAASSQLCIRAGGKHNDLENVGYTARHHTLFEMLGNFSFGDYFKEEAIKYAWDFVIKELGFPKSKIYISIHTSDDEALSIWKKFIDESRIKMLGDKDNFWQMGDIGPCGPCSEIYIDQGNKYFNSNEDYFGGDGDRFLEIWNLVFMQYERDESGNLKPLPKPSIDTGMGLERVVALLEGKRNNFDTSIFMPLINECVNITNKPYNDEFKASHRVIADHIRSIVFLLAQGVNFDKEGRGYVLRRILRRAMRHGYLLGLKEAFLYKLIPAVCDNLSHHYTYLNDKRGAIIEQCRLEEDRFLLTIESGMDIFQKEFVRSSSVFSGEVAFKLYDTYGFPLDLTQDMLKDKNIQVDLKTFNACMQQQKERAKRAWKGSGDDIKSGDFSSLLEEFGENKFIGYDNDKSKSKILALLDINYKRVDRLDGDGYVFLDSTPFYAEGGGPVGDSGEIFINNKKVASVIYTKKYFGLNISEVSTNTPLKVGNVIDAVVDKNRVEIAKHHSATHLLHSSLRKILGSHISQAGSLVESNRLRFDITHPKQITKDELDLIELEVNKMILSQLPIKIEFLPLDKAKSRGAMALFGEKYGDIVRVISFGDVSCELCGGIHISNTAFIGNFYITKESGISSGVRRIEAVCGKAGYEYTRDNLHLNYSLKETLKTQDILSGVQKLKDSIQKLKDLKSKTDEGNGLKSLNFEIIGDIKLLIAETSPLVNIKTTIDEVKKDNQKVAILLITNDNGKINIGAGVKGISSLKADNWIKKVCEIIGGGGGGRDDFATAGGKYADKVEDSLKLAREYALSFIKET